MHPSRIYGHTDDLDMVLFITVRLWFGLRVVLYPLSVDIAITFSASGYPGVVFCPVRDCRPGHFPSFSAVAHGSSEGHGMLKRNDKYHSIADNVPIPKM